MYGIVVLVLAEEAAHTPTSSWNTAS